MVNLGRPASCRKGTGETRLWRHRSIADRGLMNAKGLKLRAFSTSAAQRGVPEATLETVHLRASQINGCSVCLGLHARRLLPAVAAAAGLGSAPR